MNWTDLGTPVQVQDFRHAVGNCSWVSENKTRNLQLELAKICGNCLVCSRGVGAAAGESGLRFSAEIGPCCPKRSHGRRHSAEIALSS